MTAESSLQKLWYGPAWYSLPLWPVGWLFGLAVGARRGLYALRVLGQERAPVPVVIVGNLTVGGTGKTPIAAWLARELGRRGHRVGVVLRGYRGRHSNRVRLVTPTDDVEEVGDEALVHARGRPWVVVIGADRVAAARRAAAEGAEIVVCDDGLQHLRLARDYEIAVVDADRGLGNGHLLPAGPLREPARRLDAVDAVVLVRRAEAEGAAHLRPRRPFVVSARLEVGEAVNLVSGERRPLEGFRGGPVHALAAIGHPGAFFASLRGAGLALVEHELPDHAALEPRALPFPADATVLMTEKDAVKCSSFARTGWWYVELDVRIGREVTRDLLALVVERTGLPGAGVKLG
jgi:tetraacyldisaccharide 4'-kinase